MTTTDTREIQTFLQHIQIAATLFGTSADLAAETDPALAQTAREAWRDAWLQLGEARAIVARLGRDVTAIDAASVWARDPNLVAAGLIGVTTDMRVAAGRTIVALRAAVPESDGFVRPRPPEPSAYEVAALRPQGTLRMSPMMTFRIVKLLALIVGLVIYHFAN